MTSTLLCWPKADPGDELDYALDWTLWLSAGEIITSSEWIVPNNLTASNDSFSTTKTIVWLTGGVQPEVLVVKNRITTSDGRTVIKSVLLPVGQQS